MENKINSKSVLAVWERNHVISFHFLTGEEERLRRYIYDFLQQGLIENES